MSFYTDGLSRQQLEQLPQIGSLAARLGFYLGGGTALAIYFAHRRSLDLDWFTNRPIPDSLHLAQVIRDEGLPFTTAQVASGTLHGSLGATRVSFFEFRYPLLQPSQQWEEMSCDLASLISWSQIKADIAQWVKEISTIE